MENELENNNKFNQIKNIFYRYKKIFFSSLIIILMSFGGYIYYKYSELKNYEQMSEKFIKAGILLTMKENDKAKEIYKEIIINKNKFYSPLSLNYIIDNKLATKIEILKLFPYIEGLRLDNEEKNLIKLKKALILIDLNKAKEGKKLLDEIISTNSIWKNTASDILN